MGVQTTGYIRFCGSSPNSRSCRVFGNTRLRLATLSHPKQGSPTTYGADFEKKQVRKLLFLVDVKIFPWGVERNGSTIALRTVYQGD